MTITASDIIRAKYILGSWRTRAKVQGKNVDDLDHVIKVLIQLSGDAK